MKGNRPQFHSLTCLFCLLLLFFSATSGMSSNKSEDGDILINKFKLSPPANGTYAPWRNQKNQINCYGGELITIKASSFEYTTFSDVIGAERPDYKGHIEVFNDHIYLDHPGVPYPYRMSGIADGVLVLITWEGYEEWKKKHTISRGNILFLQKHPDKKP